LKQVKIETGQALPDKGKQTGLKKADRSGINDGL